MSQDGIDEFCNLVNTSNTFNEGMSEVYGICILQNVDSYMTKINASLGNKKLDRSNLQE